MKRYASDAWVTFAGFGATAKEEFTWQKMEQAAANQQLTSFTTIGYSFGPVTPAVTFVADNLQKGTQDLTLSVEVPCSVAKGFSAVPFAAIGLSGTNYYDNVSTASGASADWVVGFRCDYNFSAKF